MKRGRKVTIGCILVVLLLAYPAYLVVHFHNNFNLTEIYAAWDTGALIVRHMELNEGRWPSGWDDLVAIVEREDGGQLTLRGASMGDVEYVKRLHEWVRVDWAADPIELANAPAPRDDGDPPFLVVTRPDGTAFAYFFEEPNRLIWEYLQAPTFDDEPTPDTVGARAEPAAPDQAATPADPPTRDSAGLPTR